MLGSLIYSKSDNKQSTAQAVSTSLTMAQGFWPFRPKIRDITTTEF